MFSVIVPVYNHKTFVEEAVASAVNSNLVHEVLMVDDLSTDGSAALIERFPRRFGGKVRILRDADKSNKGAHERLNQLCAAASGPWISILNSDDVYPPERFAAARELIGRGCTFITGVLTLINEHSSVIGAKRGNLDPDYPLPAALAGADLNAELELFRVLCSENFILTTSNMIFARSLFQHLGGFRDLRYCHDWDFALRACLLGRPGFSHIPLTRYRIHAANTIQEPTPHVDGEVIRLLARLFDEYPWVMEDRLAVEALRGNRHLGTFVSDAEIGRERHARRVPARAPAKMRCLVVIDHEGQGPDDIAAVLEHVEALKDPCDVVCVDVGKQQEDDSRTIRMLEQTREAFVPDLAYLCGGFPWFARNAPAIRRIFGGVPIIDEHVLRDAEAWRSYYRSSAIQAFDRFVAESGAAAQLLAANSGIPRNRVVVINPVAIGQGRPVVKARGEGLTYVAPLTDDSESLLLLDIARRCRDLGWPDRFLLSVAGVFPGNGLRYISAAGLGNVELAAANWTGTADAAIVLSPAISVSAMISALTKGKPVLGIRSNETISLVDKPESGILLPQGAVGETAWRGFTAFRSGIERMKSHASERREKLLELYSMQRRSEALGKIVAQTLRREGRPDSSKALEHLA